ncbi:MAG: AbrB/MazE/SpoVT family DNA-binding domain-containing protein [Pseudomonadota bacterium]
MPASKITAKGQITIPKAIRDALGVDTGDRVEFVVRADGVVEMIARTRPLLSLAGVLGVRRLGVTVEDMDAGIAAQVEAEADGARP